MVDRYQKNIDAEEHSNGFIILHELQHMPKATSPDPKAEDELDPNSRNECYSRSCCARLPDNLKIRNAQNFAYFALDIIANPDSLKYTFTTSKDTGARDPALRKRIRGAPGNADPMTSNDGKNLDHEEHRPADAGLEKPPVLANWGLAVDPCNYHLEDPNAEKGGGDSRRSHPHFDRGYLSPQLTLCLTLKAAPLGRDLALFNKEVVYVETRDYRGPPEPTPEQEKGLKRGRKNAASPKPPSPETRGKKGGNKSEGDEPVEITVRPAKNKFRDLIQNFVDTFRGPDVMRSVYGLEIAGLVDHTAGGLKGHCSILYNLPGELGLVSRDRPAEDYELREPVTLKTLLGKGHGRDTRSALGSRFELARKLVRAVCLLHSVGWLHKNIRVESVIFFPKHADAPRADRFRAETEFDISAPALMGYIFSRPDDVVVQTNKPAADVPAAASPEAIQKSESSTYTYVKTHKSGEAHLKTSQEASPAASKHSRDKKEKATVGEGTKERHIRGFTLDYYQHPAKHADPMCLYRHAHDVYSLGILLLEVGLWERLKGHDGRGPGYSKNSGNDEGEDHYGRRRRICEEYLDRLRWTCGDTYADVVHDCLMINGSNDGVDNGSERKLCARIVASLEDCRA
ncbi:hypothetical protein LX36DRAFT_704158 [Colletotrichum falcatum]|nr:hypothetical protein LX36DRAFT_704158 [Colletotrichum falcatum]